MKIIYCGVQKLPLHIYRADVLPGLYVYACIFIVCFVMNH